MDELVAIITYDLPESKVIGEINKPDRNFF